MARPSPSSWRRRMLAVFLLLPGRIRRRLVRLATPNYTVGAVVLLRDYQGDLLLLRQRPGPGWSLPGGLLDRFEEPAAGALRELYEETGLRLRPENLTTAHPSAIVVPRIQQVDCVFTAVVDRERVEWDFDPVEVLEAKWYPAEALPWLTAPTARLLSHYGLGPWAAPRQDA